MFIFKKIDFLRNERKNHKNIKMTKISANFIKNFIFLLSKF
jgi:hypothetical protein